MSKQIKKMEMDSLRNTFQGVRDLVVLSINKLNCHVDNQMRASLRKKNIRMQVVKNSLTRRVFDELGMKAKGFWEGTTLLAWGGSSLADLSKELETLVKKNDKLLKVKGALSEGQEITFQAALKMPTRAEALGRVVSLALSPGSRLIGQILASGANLAGQIKTLSERAPEAESPPPAEAASPEVPAAEAAPVAG
jgi:large subunit ribosomal protein L10